LVRGTLGTIEIFYQKVQQEVPAVIVKGTGSAADIIAFVYDEISAKSILCRFFSLKFLCLFIHFRNNKTFEDENLKLEVSRRLVDEYPSLKDKIIKRNEIRDHLITIVKKNEQRNRNLWLLSI
jgi:hypothetical protein